MGSRLYILVLALHEEAPGLSFHEEEGKKVQVKTLIVLTRVVLLI